MNILAFRTDSTDITGYDKEIKEVKAILKDESYQQLMKAGSGNDGAAIYFVGNDDEHIEEFVLAGKKENGFAVVRVLGNDMNPTHIMNMLSFTPKITSRYGATETFTTTYEIKKSRRSGIF